ncbi:MAG: hypothetical protein EXQ85_07140 [Alphaproteobacteria bacterium]|nr:hypothetical protein [Alphaproteobacteria bacterium]
MNRRLLFVAFVLVVTLTACATQPQPIGFDPPGFWSGLLHGFIAWPALIVSIFTETRIYAFPNSGGLYDFGYMIGMIGLLGGGERAF